MNQIADFKIYPEIIKSISLDVNTGGEDGFRPITGVIHFHQNAILAEGLEAIYIVYGDLNKEIILSSFYRYNNFEQQTFIAQAGVPYYFVAQEMTTWHNKSATSNKIEIET